MANSVFRLIRRLVLQLFGSFVLAFLTLFTIQSVYERIIKLAQRYPSLHLFDVIRFFGGPKVMLELLFGLFIVLYMVLFNVRRFIYVSQIQRSVKRIAAGDFRETVPVRQNNEHTELAVQINGLVRRLQDSLAEERKSEQTKNELITNVSHDLRTPLTSLIGYLELIDKDNYRDEVELRHYVQIASDKAARLNELIRDLFDYTRLRNEQLPIALQPVDLAEMAGQLLTEYRIQLLEMGMEGRLSRPSGPLLVAGDPGKLIRVFENLLANAMQYGATGRYIDVAVRREGQQAVAEVINYGEPIPLVDLPYVFDRFYRVEKSRSEHTGGSGLGLAIAKSMIERHGGTIEADSDGTRTVFRFRLPLTEELFPLRPSS